MIEVILLESMKTGGYQTNFFDGRYQHIWPPHSLQHLSIGEQIIPVTSRNALQLHRHHHPDITRAHHQYLQSRSNTA